MINGHSSALKGAIAGAQNRNRRCLSIYVFSVLPFFLLSLPSIGKMKKIKK